jgi:hypothetical protein
VVVEDRGDPLVIVPAPDDPIAAAEGALDDELPNLDVARLRRRARDDDRLAERRRRAR